MSDTSSTCSSKTSTLTRQEQHDLLVCNICLEPYDDSVHEAKFLVCHHSFCQLCLQHLVANHTTIECPTCRHSTPITSPGVRGLQTNFYVMYMIDTFKKMGRPKMKGCKKHFNQPMSFFCQTCSIPICRDCVILDHKDADGHNYKDISAAEVEERGALANQVQDAQGTLARLQNCKQTLESEVSNLSLAKDKVLLDIDKSFQSYVDILLERKSELKESVYKKFEKKQCAIGKQIEEVQTLMGSINTVLEKCNKVSERGPLSEIITVKGTLAEKTVGIDGKLEDIDIGENYLKYKADVGVEKLKDSSRSLGDIVTDGYLPSQIKVKAGTFVTCLPCTLSMQVCSFKGDILQGYPVIIKLVDPRETCLETSIEEKEPSSYTINFQPQISGEHKITVTFLNQPIRGIEARFTVKSNNPVQVIGQRGSGDGHFVSPRAVAVDEDGSIFVADTGNRMIQKLDKEGSFVSQFCIDGGNENCSTCDLALHQSKRFIVCTETHVGMSVNPTLGSTVVLYSTDGTLKTKFTNKVMKCALCVATNSRGEIVVSDYLVHSLFMYTEEGNFIRRIGHAGTFNHPAFICIGPKDEIIVSDTNNDCVQVFDRAGNFSYQFGKSGSGKGELKQPFGVGTDGEYILVVDSGNHRIQVFKKDGTFHSLIESKGSPLNQPRGIALTADGHALVADRDHHCIKKFRYK